jgi:CRP/FNR family transcriptional regulator, cyclic AMP receptor protein
MASNQEFFASVPLFRGLTKKDLDRLDTVAYERDFPVGAEFVKEGEAGVGFFMIVRGRAEVRRGDHVLAELKPGSYFGEMSLLDDQRRSASVRAIEATHCLGLSRWDFLAEIRSNPDLAVELLKSLSRRIRALEEDLEPTQPPA